MGFLDWRADARAHLASGGVLFPFEVKVTSGGEIFVEQALGGQAVEAAGARVVKINDADAGAVTAALLARVHGDTPNFRAALLSRRFWLYYWKVFGAPRRSSSSRLAGAQSTRQIAGSARLPAVLADEDSFERQFRVELLAARFGGAHGELVRLERQDAVPGLHARCALKSCAPRARRI